MSTLEKFGILVILILVVIIGVVAVWGVRPDEANPFEKAGDGLAAAESGAQEPAAGAWPEGSAGTAAVTDPNAAPVAPPAVGSNPTPAVAGAPAPAAAATGGATYRVRKGDTLERIAKETLGDGTRWQEIVKANPGLTPKRLKIDQVLNIPGGSGGTSVASAPAPAPMSVPAPNSFTAPNPADGPSEVAQPAAPTTREVEVRSGDTLYGIAQRELGNSNLYYKIQQANPGLDPKRLRPGMKIKLPAQ